MSGFVTVEVFLEAVQQALPKANIIKLRKTNSSTTSQYSGGIPHTESIQFW
jgi:hypothetical protein